MRDHELVTRLKHADSSAFQELYHTYVQPLYGYTLKIAKSPALTEDIVHDVFVKVWENRHQIDPEQPFRAYLFSIARNLFLNLIKREKHKAAIIEEMLHHAQLAQNTTSEQVLYNESEHLLHQAIEQLPGRRKQIFELCHLKGLTYKEAAQHLNISASTVNTQMVEARKFIQAYLSDKNADPEKK